MERPKIIASGQTIHTQWPYHRLDARILHNSTHSYFRRHTKLLLMVVAWQFYRQRSPCLNIYIYFYDRQLISATLKIAKPVEVDRSLMISRNRSAYVRSETKAKWSRFCRPHFQFVLIKVILCISNVGVWRHFLSQCKYQAISIQLDAYPYTIKRIKAFARFQCSIQTYMPGHSAWY